MKYVAATICCFLICCKLNYAQNTSVFTPMPVVIFEDNFQTDSLGAFPSHWRINHKDSARYKRLCKVRNINGKRALVIATDAKENWPVTPTFSQPGPKMPVTSYLPDSFTLEYDFLLSKSCCLSVEFYATNAASIFTIYICDDHASYLDYTTENTLTENKKSFFRKGEWHHQALSYNRHQATCYIDGVKILAPPAVQRDPLKFLLGYANMPSDSFAYTNFRLATGHPEGIDSISFASNNSFVTHSIVFDINKADIRPQSIAYIKQLANWLQQNPAVRLEVDGHTDNIGEPAANLKLSQKRADAVRELLVSYGIDVKRLGTNGYGDTKPIKSNATDEGKAENRRVEFIKKK